MRKERSKGSQEKGSYLRIGWILGDQLDRNPYWFRINYLVGGIALARFYWLSQWVNHKKEFPLRYELYRPWKQYNGLLCLKAMGPRVMKLVEKYKKKGKPVWFDANVNYYQKEGKEYYLGMFPSERQMKEAKEITRTVDGVIADSEFIREQCLQYNSNVCWIPDNVAMDWVPPYRPWQGGGKKFPLLWSGEALKLFEFLSIEEVLVKYAKHIELILVTNDLSAMDRWLPEYKEKFQALLLKVPHKIIRYKNILNLFQVYANGGVSLSPRYLDNSYNLGHTEWKITLPMACGRMVLCSPVPSYVKVWERAGRKGVRICQNNEEWENAFDDLLSSRLDWEEEEKAARNVVMEYYATSQVGMKHVAYLGSFFPNLQVLSYEPGKMESLD